MSTPSSGTRAISGDSPPERDSSVATPDSAGADSRQRRYWIKTYGCQMNVHDSEIYAGLLDEMGYQEATDPQDADVILVNTCSVRERGEDKLFSQLGRLRGLKDGPSAHTPLIGVTGCIAQQRGSEIVEREGSVDFVIGTRAIHALPDVLRRAQEGEGSQVLTDDLVEFEAPTAKRQDHVKAFVTIMEGCNNYCSFCIVPTTRGLEIYRSAEAILDEIRGLSIRGYREITLLGQNVNSWLDPETGMGFAGLLEAIDRLLASDAAPGGIARVRFLTSHPKDLSPELINVMGRCTSVARHLHLPVQSGSDRVLQQMNRHYTQGSYLEQVEQLRRTIPGVGLSTDLIVGFPGETDDDFRATMELVERVEYDSFYSFEYSPRPDTAATLYDDDVAPKIKRERLIELQALGDSIQKRHNAAWVGRRAEVLVDGPSKRTPDDVAGRTSSNHIVNLRGGLELTGHLVDVDITSSGGHSLVGRAVSPPR